MSLDDRLNLMRPMFGQEPLMQPGMPQPESLIQSPKHVSPPAPVPAPKKTQTPQKEPLAPKKDQDDQVGMRKLLGFMVTLQQEVEERGYIDNNAMKKLCKDMGIAEGNLEKAYGMLNDLSEKFNDPPSTNPSTSARC
ncbi:hypothetical protein L596_025905 [Steinernema carpocapsae]|uniref:Uncharacterized protein n=1 Tax=Steinernema carpocapsae TaxID=34508 RepID=A0A4U5M985_STECR|nr:hypothetical protein L596_025905 [Steinernema carpocapsae]